MIELLVSEHAKMNAESRHELRIAFESCAMHLSFLPRFYRRSLLAAYQTSLASIQNLLGTLNDQVTASSLIKEMQHPKASAIW